MTGSGLRTTLGGVTSPMRYLQTQRLALQPFSAVDANEVHAAITPTLTRFMAFDPPESAQAFEAIWREWIRRIDEGSEYTFVVRERQAGSFIGIAAVHEAQTREPELGIWIGEHEHGKGYGRDAVAAAMQWCSAQCSPEAFRYPVAVENLASRRIAEGLGGVVVRTEQAAKYLQVVYRIPAALGSEPLFGGKGI
ncbi:GNAT family N-acetyltransferase [Stenotrophomonas maltophilia]|uniref:GNAT family N-acetyltransferase n=1 Tax=Stenotrophomonas maltophilia TaxID=40324 RepID=UPI00289606C3|nr:GNAT family N-acetyltransferase [Stenotrophomonas maltophilia]MDT3487548.1 GNAT family N-acetyltransferase [Stenotrophomonas maltophilia]